ncbi:MAG TPA: DUF1858 domain-containing protein [Phycisphaeraceae bacterium]
MSHEPITGDMRVWQVIQQHPETYEVFRSHGCPDMRRGIYAISSRFMRVSWAAKAHKIPLEDLLRDLNAKVQQTRGTPGG